MQLNKIFLLACVLLTGSCVDRFFPETARYHEVLFIECLISDDTTSTSAVRISISAPIATEDSSKMIYKPRGVSGAQAMISSPDGFFKCRETIAGTYELPTDFKVETGKSYQLHVFYNDRFFESDYQELRRSPPIDSVTYRHTVQKLSEDGEIVDGYRFFASTHDPGQGPSYYRWTLDATFLYTVPYNATHIWDGWKTNPASNKLLRTCWKSKKVSGIYLAQTIGLSENRVTEAPLNFESQYGDELSIRYSLNVRQYNISPSAMSFWENVDKLINKTGSLYETQPYQLQGNIHCTTDSTFYVVGIFEVAGASTLRLFVDKPTEFQVIPVSCILMTVGKDIPWYVLPAGSFVTEDIIKKSFLTATPSCYDCRLRDGTLEKPLFWR
jgi:hypothetical protein